MGVREVIDLGYTVCSEAIAVANSLRRVALITITSTTTLLCHGSEVFTHPACVWTTTVVQ